MAGMVMIALTLCQPRDGYRPYTLYGVQYSALSCSGPATIAFPFVRAVTQSSSSHKREAVLHVSELIGTTLIHVQSIFEPSEWSVHFISWIKTTVYISLKRKGKNIYYISRTTDLNSSNSEYIWIIEWKVPRIEIHHSSDSDASRKLSHCASRRL